MCGYLARHLVEGVCFPQPCCLKHFHSFLCLRLPLRIGIDAKWFFEGPPSGRVVVRNLVKELILGNFHHELYVFLDRRFRSEVFPFRSPRVHLVYLWGDNNLLSNVILVPLQSRKLDLDVMVYQNFPSLHSPYKRIAFIHDVIYLSHPQYYTLWERLYFAPLRLLARKAQRIITVSETEKKRIAQFGFAPSEKIDVVYHGVDPGFKPRVQHDGAFLKEIAKKYGFPSQFILYVGRLNVRKNILNLLKAMSLISNKDIPLVIVGEKDWKIFDIDKLVESLGLRQRLIFTGPIYGNELQAIYASASVFCFPSFEESFGLPALEAMASGVPVIVSHIPTLNEICADAGNYVNPNDPHDIAQMIERLLDDNFLRNRSINAGIARASYFSWSKSVESLMRSIEKTCNSEHG
jgi:glycosyltransferase involved in cell wall biosynthesis